MDNFSSINLIFNFIFKYDHIDFENIKLILINFGHMIVRNKLF